MLSPVGQPIPDIAHVGLSFFYCQDACQSFLPHSLLYTFYLTSPSSGNAVSVSLPSWRSNVAYEEGEEWVVSRMKTGYPRFFIHLIIQQLEGRVLSRYGDSTQRVMLFPSRATASRCQRFLMNKEPSLGSRQVFTIDLVLASPEIDMAGSEERHHIVLSLSCVFFPSQHFLLAKQVWQHSGDGVSSRRAEFCLKALQKGLLYRVGDKRLPRHQPSRLCKGPRRYQRTRSPNGASPSTNIPSESPSSSLHAVHGKKEYSQFVEERFGRNLNPALAARAKLAIRRRITGCLREDIDLERALDTCTDVSRRMGGLSEEDVYLYPSGMSSIFNTHQVLLANRADLRKCVCFGFPYIDTLKILEKWGPGCLFYGNGSESDLDDLQSRLERGERYLALFTEFPSNPLLNTPNLKRIRSLADRWDFVLVVDETIGNFLNVNTLTLADVVVSSLTKIFSGDSNVMGGSAVYNPHGRMYQSLKKTLDMEYEDNYWAEDAIFMERNSRDFMSRSRRINANAETIADLLHPSPLVKEVYYPKYRPSKTNYDQRRNLNGGYGGLLSVTFRHVAEAMSFFDALEIQKGPSLGTNFTLASPFVILAHYNELDWAAQLGVDANLVRISVGLENPATLKAIFDKALNAVEQYRLTKDPVA